MTALFQLLLVIETPPLGRVYANQRWKTFLLQEYLTGMLSSETQMGLKFARESMVGEEREQAAPWHVRPRREA